MVFILENLAIGSFQDAQSAQEEVFAFLNVAEEIDLVLPQEVLYYKIPIKDFSFIPFEKLKEAIDWIHKYIDKSRILVFCNSGIGRSPSVVIGYLCVVLGFSFGQAVEFVAGKKPNISILPGLVQTIDEILK